MILKNIGIILIFISLAVAQNSFTLTYYTDANCKDFYRTTTLINGTCNTDNPNYLFSITNGEQQIFNFESATINLFESPEYQILFYNTPACGEIGVGNLWINLNDCYNFQNGCNPNNYGCINGFYEYQANAFTGAASFSLTLN